MFQLNQKFWNDEKKLAARQASILNPYQLHFGTRILPVGAQYWTMCGQCVDNNGVLTEGCELDQMIKAGLIQPEQFHGVEINAEISQANQAGCPIANWYCDDFYQAMRKSMSNNCFNPAIVNADFISMPQRAVGYYTDILASLSEITGNVMVIGNFVLESLRFPHRDVDIKFIFDKLKKDRQLQFALKTADWKLHKKWYKYAGTGKESKTTMGSIIYYKTN